MSSSIPVQIIETSNYEALLHETCPMRSEIETDVCVLPSYAHGTSAQQVAEMIEMLRDSSSVVVNVVGVTGRFYGEIADMVIAHPVEQIVQSQRYPNKKNLGEQLAGDAGAKKRFGGRDVAGRRRCVSLNDQLIGQHTRG